MPVRSNMEISPGIVCSERFKQRLDVVHRQDAGRRDLPRRAALDHGGQHLAAEFDELVNADILQSSNAFAPADAAGYLLDEEIADSDEIGRASVKEKVCQ